MKTKTLAGLAALAVAAAALAGTASPAAATNGSSLTGVSITPSTVASGGSVTTTYTGIAPIDWAGAQNFVTTGPSGEVLGDFCLDSPINLTSGTMEVTNYQAEAITTTEQYFAGLCVDFNTPPVGQMPTYEAAYTVLPMVTTTDIAATEGELLAPTDSAMLTGQFHPSPWVPNGGYYQAVESSNCALMNDIQPASIPTPLTPIALPAGLTLNSTPTASGVEPMLSVSGTPAAGTAGTYKLCVEVVESQFVDHAFGYLTIVIATPPAELAKTGRDTAADSSLALGSLAVLILGAGALLVARRRRLARVS